MGLVAGWDTDNSELLLRCLGGLKENFSTFIAVEYKKSLVVDLLIIT